MIQLVTKERPTKPLRFMIGAELLDGETRHEAECNCCTHDNGDPAQGVIIATTIATSAGAITWEGWCELHGQVLSMPQGFHEQLRRAHFEKLAKQRAAGADRRLCPVDRCEICKGAIIEIDDRYKCPACNVWYGSTKNPPAPGARRKSHLIVNDCGIAVSIEQRDDGAWEFSKLADGTRPYFAMEDAGRWAATDQ